jgi:hypothetical protein
MACRRVVTARQMTAARLMVVEGFSAYRALVAAGYARSTSRAFGMLLRGSWGLREALRLAVEQSAGHLVARPVRKRNRYDRRPLAQAVQLYCGVEDRNSVSNVWLHKLYRESQRCEAIATAKPLRPTRCSRCRGPLEGKDRWCVNCQRIEQCGRKIRRKWRQFGDIPHQNAATGSKMSTKLPLKAVARYT